MALRWHTGEKESGSCIAVGSEKGGEEGSKGTERAHKNEGSSDATLALIGRTIDVGFFLLF